MPCICFEFDPSENTDIGLPFRKPTLLRQYATNPRRSLLHPLGITLPPFQIGISPEGPCSKSVQSLDLPKGLTIVFITESQHFGNKTSRIPGQFICAFWASPHRRFFAETSVPWILALRLCRVWSLPKTPTFVNFVDWFHFDRTSTRKPKEHLGISLSDPHRRLFGQTSVPKCLLPLLISVGSFRKHSPPPFGKPSLWIQ